MMSETNNKSPSIKRRDKRMMNLFNVRKIEECSTEEVIACNRKIQELEKDLRYRKNIIFKLEVEISKLKFKSFKSHPKLSIRNLANQDILLQ